MFIIGGAAVAGLAWWWLSRPKATVISPVYRVVTQGQTVSPLAASVTAAADAAANLINAANGAGAGSNLTAGSGSEGKGSQPISTGDTFPTSVYAVDTSANMAGCGLYGSY